MPLFMRLVAVLTVLLGLALMAVSAYAAKTEGDGAQSAAVRSVEDQAQQGDEVVGALESRLEDGVSPAAATVAFAWLERPTPTVVLRYAAPDDLVFETSATSGRNNLSPGVRVWQVESLKPGEGDFRVAGLGGLEIPPDQLAVMLEVSQRSGLSWQLFGAIAKVESDLGRNMATSSAGAIGYGQFLPSTWAVYGEDGDPYDFHDVIPAMARFLLDNGAPDDIPAALYMYNHSWPYVAQVLSYAAAYGYSDSGIAVQDAADDLIWPVIGPISSYFVPGHPLGIDIDQTMAPGTPVLAAHDGEVLFAGGDPCCSYGRYVILAAPSGIMTLYGHFETLAVVSGQRVSQGAPLGIVGCTGYCTGTHLHFELIDGGVRRNPLEYLP